MAEHQRIPYHFLQVRYVIVDDKYKFEADWRYFEIEQEDDFQKKIEKKKEDF